MNKKPSKFEISQLLGIGLTIVVLGIGLAYGMSILGDINTDMANSACGERADGFTTFSSNTSQCYNSTGAASNVGDAAYNGTSQAMTGVAKLPAKLGLIVGIIVAAVIIGILVRYMMVR